MLAGVSGKAALVLGQSVVGGGCDTSLPTVFPLPLEAPVSEAERVLDIPPISYSEVVQQQRERAEAVNAVPKTRASKRQKAASKRTARPPPAQAPKAKRGEVGPAVVAAVEAMIGDGLNASQAFVVVAKERGMTAGAVSANYYRVKRNNTTKTRRSQKPSAPRQSVSDVTRQAVASRGVRRRPVAFHGVSGVEAVLADLSRGVRALSDVVQQQEDEVAELHSRLDQVGLALGG